MDNKLNNKHEHGEHPNEHNFPKGMNHEHKYGKHHHDGHMHHQGKRGGSLPEQSEDLSSRGSSNASHIGK